MKKFKVPYVKAMYVRGFKIYEADDKAHALQRAKDNVDEGLQTTEVTWGDPQYEEDSFELEVDNDDLDFIEEYEEAPIMTNHRDRYDVPLGTSFPLSTIDPANDKVVIAIPDHSPECIECAANHACVCNMLECRAGCRQDEQGVRFIFAPKNK